MKHVWVAAVPNSWNVAPSGHDPISGEEVDPAEAIFGTVVYQRFTRRWGEPRPNAPRSSNDGIAIPGPLIRARVGDRLRIHFKNMDSLREDPHSMHFHGVEYKPSSDGAY
ncbi:MAG: multicopper oxidase domain-containing protein, partial [Thermoleophilaceae bacterium]